MRSITLSGHKSRRLDLHQYDPVYKTGASLFGHIGFSQCRCRRRLPCQLRWPWEIVSAFIHQKARVRGVEPRAAGLEAACSPRSTLV